MRKNSVAVSFSMCCVCAAALVSSVCAADAKPRVLTAKEAETFGTVVVNREQKRQNFIVLERIIADKQKLLKAVSDSLAANHQLKPDASYSYIAADKTLYLITTNGLPKGAKEPKKTVVQKFKTEEESMPLRKLMATRLQIENQLATLLALAEENKSDALGWDAYLRKNFDLLPNVQYEVKKNADGAFEIVERPPAKE